MNNLPRRAATSSVQPGDIDCAARTVWGEARGEIEAGQVAVAWVIRTRARWTPPAWWGGSIAAVCRKPFQFSCWNASDPNAARLAGPRAALEGFDGILAIVSDVMVGDIPDPTGGATHYKVRGTSASWDGAVVARGLTPVSIGSHDFYALGPH